MKKVLFVVPSLGMGGLERVLVNYANLFNKRGYKVTVMNFTYDCDAIVSSLSSEVRYFKSYNPVQNFTRIKRFGDFLKFNFRILPWQKWFTFHSSKYLHRKYIKEHYDIEIGFGGLNTMRLVAGADNKTLKLGWVHGIHIEYDFHGLLGYKKAKKIYETMDKILCVSDQSKESVKRIFKREKDVYVVNNPNDTQLIREKSKETIDIDGDKAFTFIMVARFTDVHKGFFRLLNVCKKLNQEGFNYKLWLVGDGPDYGAVKEKIEKEKLNNVILFGAQSNPYKYMKNADMYLCSSYTEGFSMVMMEAIILALPMLTTEVSGAKEMLDNGKYGMIVENSEEGLYEGMKKILSDKELYNHYVKMADLRKDYLSEDAVMDKLEKIINI